MKAYGRWQSLLLICVLAATSPLALAQSLGFQITADHRGELYFPSMSPPLSQRWSVDFGAHATASFPIIVGNRVFVITAPNRENPSYLYALDAQTSNVLWRQPTPYAWWEAAVYDNGTVFVVPWYVPSGGASLFAFSAIDGHQLWSTGPASGVPNAPAALNGIVYVMPFDSPLYAVRESDGTVLWAGGAAQSIPAVTPDGVYVSDECPTTYKLDPATGQQIWVYTTDECSSGIGLSVAEYRGLAYVRGASGADYPTDAITLSAANGSYVGGFNSRYSPAFWQDTVFYTEPNYLTAVDLVTARFLWIELPQSGDSFSCAPIVVNGVVYAGTAQGNVYGYSADTGSQVFSANLGQSISCSEDSVPPQAGMSAGAGLLVVPAGGELVAFQFDNFGKWQFVPSTPCRLVDTRQTHDPIQGGTSQDFTVPQLGGCNIPASALAYSLNVTVVPHGTLGYLTVWPTGEQQPYVSTMNSDGRIKANAAIVPAGYQDQLSVYASDTTDVILDINGYFAPPASGTYQFYPLAPCRVVDTRGADGSLGGPRLAANHTRDFPVLASSCIPAGAGPKAYSFNVTVVPNPAGQPLNYLTVWPKGEPQPAVSSLNNPTATAVANAVIVPAGTGGDIEVYAYNSTDLLIDINGYFASPGSGGLSMYPSTPCRVLDTRNGNGSFSGALTPPVNVMGSACAPPSSAQTYVLNATVIPTGALDYLTLWPNGQPQPSVSTLNAWDGAITSNLAIVPTTNGSIDAYAAGLTQLILDISGYFAP